MEELIRQLLAQVRLGPNQRALLQRAAASRDPDRLRQALQKVVSQLVARGELVRVTVDGREAGPGLMAVRGRSTLLDLGSLLGPLPVEPAPPTDEPGEPPATSRGPVGGPSSREDILDAMERAQALQSVQDQDHGSASWLEPIVEMLAASLPDVELLLELFGDDEIVDHRPRLFRTADRKAFWSDARVAGEAVWLPDASQCPPHVRALAGDGFASGIAVPVYTPLDDTDDAGSREEAGLLYVLALGGMDRDTLMSLGTRLSRFVTRSWRRRLSMNRLVHTDKLTGVHNRGYFDSQFALELERTRRRGSELVLLIGDIDHFKGINDTYGHQMGDQVLRTVARELLNGLRKIDLVCRIGGEEFALILPDTPLQAAGEVVARLQVRVANLRLTAPDHPDPIRVTISFGGVASPEGGDTADDLYKTADRMLYLSKQRGRNRCHFWRADDEPLLILPRYESD